MATGQPLHSLMNQLQALEASITTILMEAASKLALVTDAGFFMIVDTQEGRRFAGKRQLCDAYIDGRLVPSGLELELQVDPNVTSLRPFRSGYGQPIGLVAPPQPPAPSPRKRRRDHALDSAVKIARVAPPLPADDDVKPFVGDNSSVVIELPENDGREDEEDDAVILENGDCFVDDSIAGDRDAPFLNHVLPPTVDTIAAAASMGPPAPLGRSSSRRMDSYSNPFAIGAAGEVDASIAEIAEAPFPAPPSLKAKIDVCVHYKNDSVFPVTENEIARKIIKSTFYDVSKLIATEYVTLLRAGCLSVHSDTKQFLRARLSAIFRDHPELESVYADSYPDFKPWDYSRTNFVCVAKRILKVKRLTPAEVEAALARYSASPAATASLSSRKTNGTEVAKCLEWSVGCTT